ncbi:MAG: hypothetical protein HYY76_16360 [Acidobacteria bacterium]|nr:hypothetical protein [Acidobacteriota bacterium]
MTERFAEDLLRELIGEIDARLREAEQLRSEAGQHQRERPFWPERRRSRRTTGRQPRKPPEAA